MLICVILLRSNPHHRLSINLGVQIRYHSVTTHETMVKLAAEDAEYFYLFAATYIV